MQNLPCHVCIGQSQYLAKIGKQVRLIFFLMKLLNYLHTSMLNFKITEDAPLSTQPKPSPPTQPGGDNNNCNILESTNLLHNRIFHTTSFQELPFVSTWLLRLQKKYDKLTRSGQHLLRERIYVFVPWRHGKITQTTELKTCCNSKTKVLIILRLTSRLWYRRRRGHSNGLPWHLWYWITFKLQHKQRNKQTIWNIKHMLL